jgi:hypothetical protein
MEPSEPVSGRTTIPVPPHKIPEKRAASLVTCVRNTEGQDLTTQQDILRAFVAHLKGKYSVIRVEEDCIAKMEQVGHRTIPPAAGNTIDVAITAEELRLAIQNGANNKAPGRNGYALNSSRNSGRQSRIPV